MKMTKSKKYVKTASKIVVFLQKPEVSIETGALLVLTLW